MKPRTTLHPAIVVAAPLVLVLAVLQSCCAGAQDEGVREGNLDQQAREAKRKGELAVEGGGIDVYRAYFEGLDAAITLDTVIVGVPVASESQPSLERAHVETWYKVRVLETLSEPARQPGTENSADSFLSVDHAPATLLPLASDEILLTKAGGSIVIDGVRITQVDTDFPDLILGQTYLLFLTVGSSKQVAGAPYGGFGILSVTKQRNLSPIFGSNWLPDQLGNGAGDDLSKLRERTRRRRSPN